MNVQEVMQDACLVAQECGMAKGVNGSVLDKAVHEITAIWVSCDSSI